MTSALHKLKYLTLVVYQIHPGGKMTQINNSMVTI